MPSSVSTVIWVQTPVLPVYSQEPSSHVSFPNSPGCGMVWNSELGWQDCERAGTNAPRTIAGADEHRDRARSPPAENMFP